MSVLTIEDRNLDKNHSLLPTNVLMRWASVMDKAVDAFAEKLTALDSSEDNTAESVKDDFLIKPTIYNGDNNALVACIRDASGELIEVTVELDVSGERLPRSETSSDYIVVSINKEYYDVLTFRDDDNVTTEDFIYTGVLFLFNLNEAFK